MNPDDQCAVPGCGRPASMSCGIMGIRICGACWAHEWESDGGWTLESVLPGIWSDRLEDARSPDEQARAEGW